MYTRKRLACRSALESGGGDAAKPSGAGDRCAMKRYRIGPGYVLRQIAGEYAIVPVAAGADSPLENTVMAPNATAVFIWKCFEQPCTIADAVARAAQAYNASEDRLQSAVERFVAESSALRILEEVE